MTFEPSAEFLAFSARCGRDPLRVQGPGGNTSVKKDGRMWIKASGTELAQAESEQIFVEVDRAAAVLEAKGRGDGSCKDTVIDKQAGLRPSIETTFHAIIDWPVVAHTHSVSTIVHAIAPEGRKAAAEKLNGLPVAFVPYRKPGLPLTGMIWSQIAQNTQVIILENHGLIVAGASVRAVAELMDDVESRLHMPIRYKSRHVSVDAAPVGYDWCHSASVIAQNADLARLARAGSYYPDHVVFLGPGLATVPVEASPALLVPGQGICLRSDARPAQLAMVICLADVLCRLPGEWRPKPIGAEAEAELLNWDAEKYRQAIAERRT